MPKTKSKPLPSPEEVHQRIEEMTASAGITDTPPCEGQLEAEAKDVPTTPGLAESVSGGYPPLEVRKTRMVSVRLTADHARQTLSWARFCAAVTALANSVPAVSDADVHVRNGLITVTWLEENEQRG
jgi:hypothetical protein